MKNLFTKSVDFVKAHPKIDYIILAIGIAIFVTITLINAPRASIWFDEAFSAYISQFSFWDIARYTATDVHPPVYYWILKCWTFIFGSTDFAMRAMSIFFGAGVIGTVFMLARRLFGRAISWTTLLFLVISPMFIRYSDEARMYTIAALIVFAATWVLIKATETKSKKLWIWYAVLVALGMWTHYFTAFAWIGHWVWRLTQTWRKNVTFKQNWKLFFTGQWVRTHIIAVAIFLPWLVVMAYQLTVVQATGFWIAPVGMDTPTNYLSNMFYYLDNDQTVSWYAAVLILVTALMIILAPIAYRRLAKTEKKWFLLFAVLAWVLPLIMFVISLPPLRPSFVERYLLPSIIANAVFMAVVFVVGTRSWKPVLRAIPPLLVVGMMIIGVTNVFQYGNFNKNTNYHIFTKEVVEQIHQKGEAGQPIVTQSPWVYYEAVQYATEDFPVYFIDQTADNYFFGSLAMLKDRDTNKIKDIDAFMKEQPVIWYIGQDENGDIQPYKDSWKRIQSVSVYDNLTNKTIYRASEFTN